MHSADVRRCKVCALPETFPGVVFDQQICNYCKSNSILQPLNQQVKAELADLFRNTIEKQRGTHAMYDAVLMFSGGKDSTYLPSSSLSMLRR